MENTLSKLDIAKKVFKIGIMNIENNISYNGFFYKELGSKLSYFDQTNKNPIIQKHKNL
jgi:hypothetical protein